MPGPLRPPRARGRGTGRPAARGSPVGIMCRHGAVRVRTHTRGTGVGRRRTGGRPAQGACHARRSNPFRSKSCAPPAARQSRAGFAWGHLPAAAQRRRGKLPPDGLFSVAHAAGPVNFCVTCRLTLPRRWKEGLDKAVLRAQDPGNFGEQSSYDLVPACGLLLSEFFFAARTGDVFEHDPKWGVWKLFSLK